MRGEVMGAQSDASESKCLMVFLNRDALFLKLISCVSMAFMHWSAVGEKWVTTSVLLYKPGAHSEASSPRAEAIHCAAHHLPWLMERREAAASDNWTRLVAELDLLMDPDSEIVIDPSSGWSPLRSLVAPHPQPF